MNPYSTKPVIESEYDIVSDTTAKLYRNGVYPEKVRRFAREALEEVDDEGVARYRVAAALTEYVYREVDYEKSSYLTRADYLLEHDVPGDCTEQGVLLASLLTARSFTARFVVSKHLPDEGHLMVQTRFPVDVVSELHEEAEKYYSGEIDGVAYQQDSEKRDCIWLVCDPASYPFAGVHDPDFFTMEDSGELFFVDDNEYDVISLD